MLTKPLSEPLFSKHEKTLMEGFSNMPIEAKRSVRAKSSATLSEVRLNQKVENRRVIQDTAKLIEEGGPLDMTFDRITYI